MFIYNYENCNVDTSRPQKSSEQNGKEYVFVSREKMEQDISEGKFIEQGEYKGNLYGTSAESVESIVNSGINCSILLIMIFFTFIVLTP